MAPSNSQQVIRRLCAPDATSVTSLIHQIGWQQTESDVRELLSREESVAMGAFEEGGELLSMAALQSFEEPSPGYKWLCYVATAPQARRRGLATAVLTMLFSSVPDGSSIGLYGSVDGGPLYERSFEFVDCGKAQLFGMGRDALNTVCSHAVPLGCSFVPASAVLPEVLALDLQCYGVDRAEALSGWTHSSACWALLGPEGDAVGFVMGRPMHPGSGVFIGPLIAQSEAEAEALLRMALSALPADTQQVNLLVIDVCGMPVHYGEGLADDHEGMSLATRIGFEPVGEFPARLMARGPMMPWVDNLPKARQEGATRPFAAAGYEFG